MHSRLINWFKFSSPATFYPLAGRLVPWFTWGAVLLLGVGLYLSFFVAPTDYKQGEGYRIIFIHVPAAWMSMFLYLVMAGWAAIGLVFNTRLSAMMTSSLAPTGAMFAFLALWTGAFWGKPMWGTWWVWDARLTSELILLFLYIGFIALKSSIDDPRRGDRAGAILILVGVINIPIIYYSVQWWNTLHQGSTIKMSGETSMDEVMLITMLIMTFGCWSYAFATALSRVRCIILERERGTTWVQELIEKEEGRGA
ncbi:MAG: cytochrome c biogenesis protein CcsA [Gammaproteobacteria bacterium]|nr:cytochrome c biogenesis protein CcsA [Gammaproteobacteria bacterium]